MYGQQRNAGRGGRGGVRSAYTSWRMQPTNQAYGGGGPNFQQQNPSSGFVGGQGQIPHPSQTTHYPPPQPPAQTTHMPPLSQFSHSTAIPPPIPQTWTPPSSAQGGPLPVAVNYFYPGNTVNPGIPSQILNGTSMAAPPFTYPGYVGAPYFLPGPAHAGEGDRGQYGSGVTYDRLKLPPKEKRAYFDTDYKSTIDKLRNLLIGTDGEIDLSKIFEAKGLFMKTTTVNQKKILKQLGGKLKTSKVINGGTVDEKEAALKEWCSDEFGRSLRLITEKLENVGRKDLSGKEREELLRLRAEQELLNLKKGSSSEKRKRILNRSITSPGNNRAKTRSRTSSGKKKGKTGLVRRILIEDDIPKSVGTNSQTLGNDGNGNEDIPNTHTEGIEASSTVSVKDLEDIRRLLETLMSNQSSSSAAANTSNVNLVEREGVYRALGYKHLKELCRARDIQYINKDSAARLLAQHDKDGGAVASDGENGKEDEEEDENDDEEEEASESEDE